MTTTRIKLESVLSYSSQDNKFPAANLLKNNAWLCSAVDARKGRAEIVIRLSTCCVLSHIDIGNYGSFTIEVQVSCGGDNSYYTLINASTFMSAAESRNTTNRHAVRMFKTEDFDSAYSQHSWDRIKLVCSQPYGRKLKFGVSFLKLMSEYKQEGDTDSNEASTSQKGKLESFKSKHELGNNNYWRYGDKLIPVNGYSPNHKWFKDTMKGKLQQIVKSGKTSQNNDRSMRMVIASLKSPDHKTPLVQDLIDGQATPPTGRPTFMTSVRKFFRTLDLTSIDPFTMKVSELRRQFEKVKCRKLSSGEKKLFKKYAVEFFETRYGDGRNAESQSHADGRKAVRHSSAVSSEADHSVSGMTHFRSPSHDFTLPVKSGVHSKKNSIEDKDAEVVCISDSEEEDNSKINSSCLGESTNSNSLSTPGNCINKSDASKLNENYSSLNAKLDIGSNNLNEGDLSTRKIPISSTSVNTEILAAPIHLNHSALLDSHNKEPPGQYNTTSLLYTSTPKRKHFRQAKTRSNTSNCENLKPVASETSDVSLRRELQSKPKLRKKISTPPVKSKLSNLLPPPRSLSKSVPPSLKSHSRSRPSRKSTGSLSTAKPSSSKPLRSECKPELKKRSLQELIDSDDDLMIPTPKRARGVVNNSSSAGKSQLTIGDLLSSDEEDNVPSTLPPSTAIICLSDSEGDPPELSISDYPHRAQMNASSSLCDGSSSVQCPICQRSFPQHSIEAHASECGAVLS